MAEAPTTVDRAHPSFNRWSNWRVGIVGHLGLSFAAVGLLAAIANSIVEQGVSIIEITRVAPALVAAPVVMTIEEPRSAPPALASLTATGSALIEAVDRYGAAVVVRAQIYSPENEARIAAAQVVLLSEQANLFEKTVGDIRRDLNLDLDRYRETGTNLTSVADQRRQTVETYTDHLRSLRSLLDQSVNASWKIFGRVVARQTVLKLRADHDQLQSTFTALSAADALDPVAVTTLIQREAIFDATLSENERGLIRSEGREWISNVRSEFHQLIALRAALVIDWQRLDKARQDFLEAGTGARERAEAIPDLGQPTLAPQTNQGRQFVGPILDDVNFVGPPLLDSVPVSAATGPVTRVARQETDKAKQLFVAWVSGGVLLIVLLISIGTVRSIVVPIRRLLHATNQLGKSETHEPVPRGGIKELDRLAQSFNQMAEELVAARRTASEHQIRLEERVLERTRELQELAECDPLTGLPNRRHLLSLLETALTGADSNNQRVAVFFLDLDNFKNINDSMGHGFGDEVLKAIAKRLENLALGVGFAARLGGDEFTVVFTSAKSGDSVRAAGLEMIDAFHKALLIGNRELTIGVSVGASIYPDHDDTAEGLLKAADAALFRAKALGRSQLSVYTPELLAEAATRFATEQGLRRAVERGEFELVFQPEVSVDTLETALVEALVRWRMPDGRLASPGEFFAVAEESGLITEIGDWVLRAAIGAAAQWYHGEWPQARVAINVSPRQLLDHRFVEKVQALLLEFQVPSRCIEIELTETVLQTGATTIDVLHRLHTAGLAIALDDFGTGYSTLASLEKLPLTRIKLDRSLVADIATRPRSAAIAKAIIRLCHDLKLEVTAEGVETLDQLEILARHQPITLQGFLLSKAVQANDLPATLERLAHDMSALLIATRSHGISGVSANAVTTLASHAAKGHR
jgi:diguanylate cyclase (GGDEF)-like protein